MRLKVNLASERRNWYSVFVRIMKYSLLIILLVTLLACSRKDFSTRPISDERFEDLYIELLDSMHTTQPATLDSLPDPVSERILQRHNVSLEEFKATVAFYNAETRKWKDFYEHVAAKMEQRTERKPATSTPAQ